MKHLSALTRLTIKGAAQKMPRQQIGKNLLHLHFGWMQLKHERAQTKHYKDPSHEQLLWEIKTGTRSYRPVYGHIKVAIMKIQTRHGKYVKMYGFYKEQRSTKYC